MQFTIEEINNSTIILPGESVGYEMYDTCLSSIAVIHSVLMFLAQNGTNQVEMQCNLTEYKTRVMAVIGPSSTEVATSSMKILSTVLIPQVSYAVTSDVFSDKNIYPSFYRTVPSDSKQVDGMIALISYFRWNWIAVVGSDDDYGKSALQQFSSSAMSSGICISYKGLIPVYLSTSDTTTAIENILDEIEKADVNVVLVFASLTQSIAFFKEVIMRNMTQVWIASASWVLSQSILSMPGIERIGTVIGFFPSVQTIPGFDIFVKNTISKIYANQLSSQSTSTSTVGSNSDYQGLDFKVDQIPIILNPLTELNAQSVYTAVYAVAYALHNLLNCNSVKCNKKNATIYPWSLLKEVRKVNFSVFNTTFGFDVNGNPKTGYDIVIYNLSDTDTEFIKIGSYNNVMDLNSSLIYWGTPNNKVPESQCSGDCLPGQIKRVKGTHSCCYDCIDCQEGFFQSADDDFECYICPAGQWSNIRSTVCSDPTYLFLQWTDTSVIFILLLTSVLFCTIIGTFVIFVKNRQTALVRASGGYMSFLALSSLLAVTASIVLFIGQPTMNICKIQQPLQAIGFTCCLSTFSIKALQVILVTDFKCVDGKYIQWLKTKGTWASLLLSILIQCLFCVWYIKSNQFLSPDEKVTYLRKYLKCEISNVPSFALMFGYNGILVLMSFMLNCVAQAPPGQYNLARDITFSMLGYLLIWIVFVPAYAKLTDGNQPLLQMVVALVSSFAIIFGYFFPKCYILIMKPDMASEEYFKIYNN
ncbi:taste receptor type 1 member 3-like [Pelobates cultripes]|uniref:Taste receptor type 1 member 3 n=1 Tax=Pelobates cultripes TaxID=61616 RepID=A0AAD1T8W1_PELCU|nr:taste receptor type 1 member 3-like [Pelobates cultripes]